MTTANTRRTAATLAAAAAVAVALPLMSAIAPTVASAHRADPLSGPTTHREGSFDTVDVALEIAHRKAQMARNYVEHTLELHQRAVR